MIISNCNIETNKGRKLITDLSFNINKGDKLALIGEEGDGKSTFIKALVDPRLIPYAKFSANLNIEKPIGYFHQFLSSDWDNLPVYEYFLRETPDSEPDYDVYKDFNNLSNTFSKFGLSTDLLNGDQMIGTLSGGEKVKLQLIKISYQKPEIYLFDEPTNDIDIETLEILEKFILSRKEPVIFVSHDETFIEHCANCILHFEQIKKKTQFKYTFYRGSFPEYVDERYRSQQKQDQIAKFEETQYKNKMETINKLIQAGAGEKVVRRLMAQKERMEKKGLPAYVDTESAIGLCFPEIEFPKNKVVCDVKGKRVAVGERVLVSDANLYVDGPQKVVIIGKNGVGKTTLLREIYDDIKNRPSIKVGYMPQNYAECMDMSMSPIEFLCPNGNKEDRTFCYTLMGACRFTSEEMSHAIKDLSGGQLAKLYLLKMVFDECNVLVLDEPTRNLSPTSNPVIREILKDFGGAIISVSHDRKYINEVCDHVYTLTKEGLKENQKYAKKNKSEEPSA